MKEQTIFANSIPTGIISNKHIDTSSMSEEEKERILLGSNHGSQSPSQDALTKMAKYQPSVAKAMEEDIDIKGIRVNSENYKEVIRNGKQRTTKDISPLHGYVRSAHVGEMDMPQVESGEIKVNPNLLIDNQLETVDSKISHESRLEIRRQIEARAQKHVREYDEMSPVTHGRDIDPITGFPRNISNISETTNRDKTTVAKKSIRKPSDIRAEEKELDRRASIISAAVRLQQEANQSKIKDLTNYSDNYDDDALNKIRTRISKSTNSLREHQRNIEAEAEAIKDVSPEQVTEMFSEYFRGNKTTTAKLAENIKEYNEGRRNSILQTREIKTSLDRPSLPTKSSQGVQRVNSLVDRLPKELLDKYRNAKD